MSHRDEGATGLLQARFAVLAFLIAVPGCALLVRGLGGHDVSRIAQIVVCALCSVALVAQALIHRNRYRAGAAATLATSALLLVVILSVWHAPNVAAAARELALFLGLAGAAAVIAGSQRIAQLDVLVIAVVSAALLGAGLVLMIVVTVIVQSGRLDPSVIVPGYDNYRFFNHVQTVAMPLLTIATSRTFRRGELARLAWTALTLNFALLYFTQGRATGVALIGASLLVLLLFRRRSIPFLRHLAIAAAMGALLYFALFVALPILLSNSSEASRSVANLDSYNERLKLWRLAIGHVAEHPWLGIGPMHYAHQINPIAAHPHSIYLQVAAEWGVPMLVGLLSLGVWATWRLALGISATKSPGQAVMGIALFGAVAALAIDGVFSGNFVMPVSQMWIAFAVGWSIAWARLNSPPPSSVGGGTRRWPLSAICRVLVLASQAWLCWSAWPEIADLIAHLDRVGAEVSKSASPAPRFWSNGWF